MFTTSNSEASCYPCSQVLDGSFGPQCISALFKFALRAFSIHVGVLVLSGFTLSDARDDAAVVYVDWGLTEGCTHEYCARQ